MYLVALTIGTSASQQSEFTYVFSAPPAVIAPRAEKKLIPAVFAEIFVGFADIFAAVDTDRRPEKMVQTLQCTSDTLF
jgi:hypothetical protein